MANALSQPPTDQECPTLEPEVLDDIAGGKDICGMEVKSGNLRWLAHQLPEIYSPGHVDHLLQRPPRKRKEDTGRKQENSGNKAEKLTRTSRNSTGSMEKETQKESEDIGNNSD